MILIADSGSTTTDWRCIKDNQVFRFSTDGINPYIESGKPDQESIIKSIPDNINRFDKGNIYFYGSGCAKPEHQVIIGNIIKKIFTNCTVEIESDLLGAARALYQNKKGIVVILGTGASVCYYNGEKVDILTPSLGYILGDEGSGAYIGKKFIHDILNKIAPVDILDNFNNQFGLSKDEILIKIYKEDYPNRFLASFIPYINSNIAKSYFQNLIISGFDQLFSYHISKYPDYKKLAISFVGSVAYIFSKQLTDVAQKYQCTIQKIIKEPIEQLIKYHKN